MWEMHYHLETNCDIPFCQPKAHLHPIKFLEKANLPKAAVPKGLLCHFSTRFSNPKKKQELDKHFGQSRWIGKTAALQRLGAMSPRTNFSAVWLGAAGLSLDAGRTPRA